MAAPRPPILRVRPGIAFWVEAAPPESWSATADALAEGCFDGALCCDGGGGVWEVLSATASGPVPLLPWRRLRVAISLGPRREMTMQALRELLEGVLAAEGSFTEALDQASARAAFAGARDIPGLIAAAASPG